MLFLEPKAKINFGLDIISKRKDGYHNIKSIFLPLKFSDHLIIEKKPYFELKVEGDAPRGKENIVYKAANLFYRKIGRPMENRIILKKRIPPGSGLGGGSSDAGYLLKALNRMYDDILKEKELKELAKEVGADVLFFLNPYPSMVEGVGDLITPIKFKKKYVLLILPEYRISTAWAYRRFDEMNKRLTNHINFIKIIERLNRGGIRSVRGMVWNVFEDVVFGEKKELKELKQRMDELCENGIVMMSGTGSCLYCISDEEKEILELKEKIDKRSIITYVDWDVV